MPVGPRRDLEQVPAVVVVPHHDRRLRRGNSGEHPPGHRALALIGGGELDDGPLVAHSRVKAEPEAEPPPAETDVVAGFRDGPRAGLGADDLRRLDRGGVHSEPSRHTRDLSRQPGDERLLDPDERLAAAVVAARREQAGEEGSGRAVRTTLAWESFGLASWSTESVITSSSVSLIQWWPGRRRASSACIISAYTSFASCGGLSICWQRSKR